SGSCWPRSAWPRGPGRAPTPTPWPGWPSCGCARGAWGGGGGGRPGGAGGGRVLERGGGGPGARPAARLRLAAGEPAVAAGLLERSLEDHGVPQVHGEHRLRAAAALETLVAARVALGDLHGAGA